MTEQLNTGCQRRLKILVRRCTVDYNLAGWGEVRPIYLVWCIGGIEGITVTPEERRWYKNLEKSGLKHREQDDAISNQHWLGLQICRNGIGYVSKKKLGKSLCSSALIDGGAALSKMGLRGMRVCYFVNVKYKRTDALSLWHQQ